MTWKRFAFQNQEQHLNKIYDTEKGRVVFDDELCDLLNEQHEQIQHLESRIKDYDVALKSLQDLTDRKLKENEQLKQFKEQVFLLIDKRIRTLKANSKQCHHGGSHEKGIEFTLQAELLERLKMELEE